MTGSEQNHVTVLHLYEEGHLDTLVHSFIHSRL
jgi:hypothetical protein